MVTIYREGQEADKYVTWWSWLPFIEMARKLIYMCYCACGNLHLYGIWMCSTNGSAKCTVYHSKHKAAVVYGNCTNIVLNSTMLLRRLVD